MDVRTRSTLLGDLALATLGAGVFVAIRRRRRAETCCVSSERAEASAMGDGSAPRGRSLVGVAKR